MLLRYLLVIGLVCSWVKADTPAPGSVYIKGGTDNTLIGNHGNSQNTYVTNPVNATISGNVPVTQVTSPWVTSVNNFPSSFGVTQNTSPWVISGNTGRTWTLNAGTDSVSFSGTVTATNPSVSINGTTLPGSSTLIGGQLGANLQPLQLNASKYLYVDGSQVTQPVSGTVSVNNFPATQTVNGTVTANAGSGNFTVIQPLGSALHTDIDNFPSSQNVVVTNSPTVSANQSGAWTTGRTWTLNSGTDSVMIGNTNISVTQATNPWAVSGTVTSNAGSGTFQVGQATGTNLHTVIDNFPSTFGVTQSTSPWVTSRNWTLSGLTDSVNISNFPATFGVTQSTSPWVVGGTITANAGSGTFQTNITNSSLPVTQSGSWTNTVTQSTPGNLNATVYQGTSPWLVNSTAVGGTLTANQGTPNSVGNSWPTKITDGTNVTAVKPASTAPSTSDPSLVVAISPNSPITVTSVPPSDMNVTGNITSACPSGSGCASTAYVQIEASGFTSLGFETHGTWNATLTQDISYDPLCASSPSTVLWYPTAAFDNADNELLYVPTWGNALNNDPWILPIAGAQCARIRAVAYTSGTVHVTLNSGVGTAAVYTATVGNIPSGSTDFGNPLKVGGKYNSVLPTFTDGQRGDLQLDANGRLQVLSGRTWNLSSGSDSVAATQSGTWTVNQGGAPWSVSQSGAWTTGRTWNLSSGSDSVNVGNFPSTFGVTQSTSPWVVSGTVTANAGSGNFQVVQSLGSNLHVNVDSAPTTSVTQGSSPWVNNISQFGGNNVVTGTGASGVGIPRVTVANDSNILATQSGSWTTGRTWNLSSGSDSVSAVQSGTWNINLPTNAAIETGGHLASLDSKFNSLGQKSMANSVPMVIASDQSAIPVSQNGTWTIQQGATPTSIANAWPVKPTDGTNSQGYTASNEAKVLVTPLTNSSVVKSQLQDNAGNGLTSATVGSSRALDGNVVQNVTPNDHNASGTLSAACSTPASCPANSTVTINSNGIDSVIGSLSGTWSGTVIAERYDGQNWVQAFTASSPTGTLGQNNLTTNGTYRIAGVGGYQQVRFRMTTFSSGSATAIVNGSLPGSLVGVYQTVAGNLQAQINGNNGGSPIQLNADSSGNAQVVGNVASGSSDSGAPVKIGGKHNSTQPTISDGQRGDVQLSLFGDISKAENTKFANITTATTTTVKSGAGLLYKICFNNIVNGATVSIYDNTTATTPTIGTITETSGGGLAFPAGGCYDYGGMNFTTGLTIVTSGAQNLTVTYK